jgi:acyl carrier protein
VDDAAVSSGHWAMSRLGGAIQACREAIATAADLPFGSIGPDEDLIDDLGLDTLELVSVALILEEIFSIPLVPDDLFETPLYRTPVSLAEWCIRKSEEASWTETQRQRKRS